MANQTLSGICLVVLKVQKQDLKQDLKQELKQNFKQLRNLKLEILT